MKIRLIFLIFLAVSVFTFIIPVHAAFVDDMDIDGSDLAVFAAEYNNCAANCSGDFTSDGDVDHVDLSLFLSLFGINELLYELTVQEVDSSGGTIEITDAGNPIVGTKVVIPDYVLSAPITVIAVPTALPMSLPSGSFQAGTNIRFGSNIEAFSSEIELHIPYHDVDNDGFIDGTTLSEYDLRIMYFDGSAWNDIPVISQDLETNILTVLTTHFSDYVAYANNQTVIYDQTPVVPNGTIVVDGDPSDWSGIAGSTNDPVGDNRSGSPADYDIQYVYTAMDENYAYVLVQTGGIIPADATLEIYINHKPGEAFSWLPYADMGMNHHPDSSSYWDQNGGFQIQNTEVVRGNTLEVKIPLSELDNPSYFNVILTKIWVDHYSDTYDEWVFGPYMDFWINDRDYITDPSFTRVQFEFTGKNGNYVAGAIDFERVTLTFLDDPGLDPIDLTVLFEPWHLLFGRYDSNNAQWIYSPEFSHGGSNWADFDPGYLNTGNYRLEVIDALGNKYQRDYYYAGSHVAPEVHLEAENVFFDPDGNLYVIWDSPNTPDDSFSIRLYPYADNGHPEFTAVWATIPPNLGYAYVPAAAMGELFATDGPYKLQVQVRSADRSHRWYSEIIDLSTVATDIPEAWTQPIIEDWSNAFDTLYWYPIYWGEGAIVDVNDSVTPYSVDLETINTGNGGEALYRTKYRIAGDFDVQVEFDIQTWPQVWPDPGHRIEVVFQFGMGGGNDRCGVGMVTYPDSPQKRYISYLLQGEWWPALFNNTNDVNGRLRIKRVGSDLYTYYWDNAANDWTQLGFFENGDIGPQPLNIVVTNNAWDPANQTPANVRVKFLNFKRNQ